MIEKIITWLPSFFGAFLGMYFTRKNSKMLDNVIKLIAGTAGAQWLTPLIQYQTGIPMDYVSSLSFVVGAFTIWIVQQVLGSSLIDLIRAMRGLPPTHKTQR